MDVDKAVESALEIESVATTEGQPNEPIKGKLVAACKRIQNAMWDFNLIVHRCEVIKSWADVLAGPDQEDHKRKEAREHILRNTREMLIILRTQQISPPGDIDA
jgi:hypothetical protein